MPTAQLHERIQELLDELDQIDTDDSAARDRITHVLQDIREAIDEADSDRNDSLIERLNDATRQFEESHPTLTRLVGRVAESLSNLGI